MYYQRSDKKLPLQRRLSREELKVYTICRDSVTLQEIVQKSGLDQVQVIFALNSFISEGLVNILEH